MNRIDLSLWTIFKPLEGFRFHSFLAQPLALIIGWVAARYAGTGVKRAGPACFIVTVIISIALTFDLMYINRIAVQFQNSGISVPEYRAAVWFRNNTSENDRIIADYFRSQVFAGVCGGKALLGGLFPLRNCNLPYVSMPAVVQDDICTIYTTPDPKAAVDLMRKYGSDCVFISPFLLTGGYLASRHCNGYGIKADLKKFDDREYFTEIYNDTQGILIFKIRPGVRP